MKLFSFLLFTSLLILFSGQPSVMAEEMESRHHRMNQNQSGLVGLIGVRGGAPETSLRYEKYLDSNRQISLSFLSFSGDMEESSFTHESTKYSLVSEVKGEGLAIGYKQYSGNSFYIRGMIDYIRLSGDADLKIGDSIDGFSIGQGYSLGSFRRFSVGTAIGNQWSWERFTLGCDWLGYSIPLWKKGNLTDSGKRYHRSFKRLSKEGVLFSRFFLGMSW